MTKAKPLPEKRELKLPCPVCLGSTLQKVEIKGGAHFILDHCVRCGGVWFEQGEVQLLRKASADDLWAQIAEADGVHRMQCHSCSHRLERTERKCTVCGWDVELDCPSCGKAMHSEEHAGIQLEACKDCKGVWFDRHELADIWRDEFNAAVMKRSAGDRPDAVVFGAVMTDPFMLYYGAHAAGHVLAAGAHAAPAVLEAAGEAASSVFETIVEIISGIFN
jgi:Zn-finger nucleic acid-binding protein